ncbi:unnamed protein product, partial [Brassica napus]
LIHSRKISIALSRNKEKKNDVINGTPLISLVCFPLLFFHLSTSKTLHQPFTLVP